MTSSNFGAITFPAEPVKTVTIKRVAFENEHVILYLSDNRAIYLPLAHYPWLKWLQRASLEQREQWEIMPSGGGVWWEALDEGIELQPLLDMTPLI